MKKMMMTTVLSAVMAAIASPAFAQAELYNQTLFVYDDSWQPPNCQVTNDGFLGLPSVTCGNVRALRHEMTLVVKGPNDQYVRSAVNGCMQEAAGAGVVAGLAAVYTGGVAMPAAWGAFQSYFFGCMSYKGANAVSIQIDDRSHWVE